MYVSDGLLGALSHGDVDTYCVAMDAAVLVGTSGVRVPIPNGTRSSEAKVRAKARDRVRAKAKDRVRVRAEDRVRAKDRVRLRLRVGLGLRLTLGLGLELELGLGLLPQLQRAPKCRRVEG